MSSKKIDRKRKSIVWQLHFMWLRKLLLIICTIDLVLAASCLVVFFSMIARQEFDGDYDIFNYNYSIYEESDNVIAVSMGKKADTGSEKKTSLKFDTYTHKKYYVIQQDDKIETDDMTVFIDTFTFVSSVLLIAEGIMFLSNLIFGVYRIRAKFAPIDNMARMASQLGDKAESHNYYDMDQDEPQHGQFVNEKKVHNLEEAIYNISPDGADEYINMSDPDLKGLEAAINCMLDKMRQSYKQQTRFVSDASHELRTPIAVIQGYVNMLDRWGKDDEKILQESIDAIKNESDHMKKLVEQLLFLARGDSGRNKFTMSEVDVNTLINEIYEESVMIDERHVYSCDLYKGDIKINADESMLKQAVRILVDNAAKYTAYGEKIRVGSGIDENSVPYIYVQDNGKGIESENMRHIFERFYRTDDSRQSKTGGTGLGLSIAEWIVQKHGGYFKVKSYKDIGTRITIMLPHNENVS